MMNIASVTGSAMAPAGKAVSLEAGTDRHGKPLNFLNGEFICKVSSQDTLGGLCIYDTVRTARGGPPMHIHHAQDEWFYVREGEFVVQIGDERFQLLTGDSLLAPRKIPHAFANVSETGRLIVAFQPAGSIERLFSEIAAVSGLRIPTLADWQTVSRRNGVDIVGPPLTI